jgi:hypothetical protein
MKGSFPSQSTGKEFFFVFFGIGYDEAIGTFNVVLALVVVLTVNSGEIFCIVKLASGARDLPFVKLVILLISHPDFIVSLQWVVVNVTLRWSSVGVLSNVQFSWALFSPLSGSILIIIHTVR